MPRLVLLNGPPGIGKSTLARRYVDDHPLALCLDIDAVRRQLGRWRDQPGDAGRLARRLALAMLGVQLAAGHDVVVAQFLGRAEFLDELERAAAQAGCPFVEVVLTDSKDNALARFADRASDPRLRAHHADAAALAGGSEGLAEMYDRLEALLRSRPRARVVRTTAGDVDGTYRRLLAVLDGPAPP